MKNNYKIMLCGENVFLHVNHKTQRYGFYINIFTFGENEEAVVKKAKKEVMKKLQSKPEIVKEMLDIIELKVEEIVIIGTADENEKVKQGFTWYLDNKQNN